MDIVKEIERIRRCCDRRDANWQALPVEGASFVSCFVESYGKRGTMILLTREYPPLHIPLAHNIVFGELDGLEQRFLAIDDSTVGLILDPAKGKSVRLLEAKVNYYIRNVDPAAFFAPPPEGEEWHLQAHFDLVLRFGVTDTVAE